MAIYQFLIFVLPKEPIQKEYVSIPSKIDFILDPDGDRTQKWWRAINFDIRHIEQKIDMIISRTDFADLQFMNWKSENSNFDHDINIDVDNKEFRIEEFQIRVDLREQTFKFVHEILNILSDENVMLMDQNGNLCEPTFNELIKLITKSDAHRFLLNPGAFLDDLK